jgi:hypothetical protein
MDKDLELAKQTLNIMSVNLQSSEVCLSENILASEFSVKGLVKQIYRNVISVIELEAGNDEKKWFEYHFIYAVGMRFIEPQDDADDLVENEGEDSSAIILEIKGKFKAIYLSFDQLDSDKIKAFSSDNVGYHVWPYWREFVQSTCNRLAIETVSVPTYIVDSSNEIRQEEPK